MVVLRGALEGEGRREQAKSDREKMVVWILPATKGAQTNSPMLAGSLNRGLSFHVGEELAKRIRQRHGWAVAMFAEIRRRSIDERCWGESEKARSRLCAPRRRPLASCSVAYHSQIIAGFWPVPQNKAAFEFLRLAPPFSAAPELSRVSQPAFPGTG